MRLQRLTVLVAVAAFGLTGCARFNDVGTGAAPSGQTQPVAPPTTISDAQVTAQDNPAPAPGGEDVVPPPPDKPVQGPDSLEQIQLPKGPGQLLPTSVDPAQVAKDMAAAGVTEQDLIDQQSWINDVGTKEYPFSSGEELAEPAVPVKLFGASIPQDNLVIAVLLGRPCTEVVGGYAYWDTKTAAAVVVVYAGDQVKQGSCDDEAVPFRLTLYVPGAVAESKVITVGGPANPDNALLPMIDQLSTIVLLPKDLPYYTR